MEYMSTWSSQSYCYIKVAIDRKGDNCSIGNDDMLFSRPTTQQEDLKNVLTRQSVVEFDHSLLKSPY